VRLYTIARVAQLISPEEKRQTHESSSLWEECKESWKKNSNDYDAHNARRSLPNICEYLNKRVTRFSVDILFPT